MDNCDRGPKTQLRITQITCIRLGMDWELSALLRWRWGKQAGVETWTRVLALPTRQKPCVRYRSPATLSSRDAGHVSKAMGDVKVDANGCPIQE